MHGGTVVATGIMDEIRTLLSKGRTSRAIIDAGYAPGTVYKVQRGFRSGDNSVRSVQSTSGSTEIIQNTGWPGVFNRVDPEIGNESPWAWHPSAPVACPDCGTDVAHWDLCRECDRFVPSDCGCVKGSRAQVAGFGLNELLDGTSRAATRTA